MEWAQSISYTNRSFGFFSAFPSCSSWWGLSGHIRISTCLRFRSWGWVWEKRWLILGFRLLKKYRIWLLILQKSIWICLKSLPQLIVALLVARWVVVELPKNGLTARFIVHLLIVRVGLRNIGIRDCSKYSILIGIWEVTCRGAVLHKRRKLMLLGLRLLYIEMVGLIRICLLLLILCLTLLRGQRWKNRICSRFFKELRKLLVWSLWLIWIFRLRYLVFCFSWSFEQIITARH